jgi:FkbM family methyltransferase
VRVRGVPLALHQSPDYVSDHIRRTGEFYEADVLDAIRDRLWAQTARGREPGVLVDAGAMIGNHTVYLAEFAPHSAIHAFEPAPVNLGLLKVNTAHYRNVHVHTIALSDKAGRLAMSVHRENRGHATVAATDPWPEPDAVDTVWEADARTLDSYGFEDVRLIKIDVEWHEPQVLAGAAVTIERWHPLIVIEDWGNVYGSLLPGYRLAAEWEQAHQTFLYEWAGAA